MTECIVISGFVLFAIVAACWVAVTHAPTEFNRPSDWDFQRAKINPKASRLPDASSEKQKPFVRAPWTNKPE